MFHGLNTLALLLVWAPLIASAAPAARAPGCTGAQGNRAVHVHGYVAIGGIEQWITIDGADCGNPVILFVHGGPGNPLSPYIDQLYGAWQETFTLATWDQRLSGRTYARNEPVVELTEERLAASELTIEQLVADGLEVAEHVRDRLGSRKLILLGTSWGSVLGVHMAHQRPQLFHAYVGVSQLVNAHDDLAASYAATLALARSRKDVEYIATLEEIGAPPWKNPRNFGRMRRIIRGYEAGIATPGPALKVADEYASGADRAAYEAGEELSFVKYVGLAGDGMAAKVDLPALGTNYRLPMYFVQGEDDLLTLPSVTRAFHESLRAPRKKLVIVPGAGHDPNFAMIHAQFRLLKDAVL